MSSEFVAEYLTHFAARHDGRFVDRSMILVPIKVKHRVNTIWSDCADMIFNAGDDIVQCFVQTCVGEVVLADRGCAKRF